MRMTQSALHPRMWRSERGSGWPSGLGGDAVELRLYSEGGWGSRACTWAGGSSLWSRLQPFMSTWLGSESSVPPFPSCKAWGRSFCLFEPQFPHM